MPRPSVEVALDQLRDDSRSLWVPHSIPEYDTKGETVEFLREHVGQSVPCVWRATLVNWPALSKWSVQNPHYLHNKIGDKLVEVAWTPDGRADSIVDVVSPDGTPQMVFAMPHQRQQRFGDLLDHLREHERDTQFRGDDHTNKVTEPGVPYYSAQDSSLTREVPELLEDVDVSTINFAKEAFGAEACAINLWCGDGRSITTMHADPFENLYAVVRGTKVFRLRPPCDAGVLRKPTLKRARWEMMDDGAAVRTENALVARRSYRGWRLVQEEGVTNWIDERGIDERCGRELVVKVEAGDLLYLPALWFHHVSQSGLTIAVNWWFEMKFGRDWVYRELCFNIQRATAGSRQVREEREATKRSNEQLLEPYD